MAEFFPITHNTTRGTTFFESHDPGNDELTRSSDSIRHRYPTHQNRSQVMPNKKYKVGVLCICLNENYWPFVKELEFGLNTFFLKNHDVEVLLWTDMSYIASGAKIFKTEPLEWPMPTLMRYHLFLQQEEELKKYDYLFYIDVDMLIVDFVGDEILGPGLTAAQHPMYALRNNFVPPYESNPESKAYIPLPGRVVDTIEEGKPTKRFQPLYLAGGFQGGKTEEFIKAMKVMRKNVDDDFARNYIARWNDESHWNRYLFDNPPSVVLDPSYVYPDSLIGEYYIKVWGRNYSPKIVTITKKFTTSKQAGAAIQQQLATL